MDAVHLKLEIRQKPLPFMSVPATDEPINKLSNAGAHSPFIVILGDVKL